MISKPRVVLYNPRAPFFTMPLSLLAVGSALDRSRCEVTIVDGRLEDDPIARIVAETRDALLLGVSVLTGAPIRDALAVSRAAKAARPDLHVVWGGWHPSLFAAECLVEPSIDATVAGQGEDTLVELVDRLAAGTGLAGCRGAAFRQDGRVVVNPPRPLRELSELPAHDYGLINVERYFERKRRRQLDYVSSQGCRFRCGFCADPEVYRRGWVGLPPERIAAEIAGVHRRQAFDEVAFQDETFFTQPRRVEGVCEALIATSLPITWTATLRADQACRLSEAQFALARRSGLTRVMIGVESGSQAMLDRMEKDTSVEQVLAAAERLVRHGIGGIFNFIVGFPDESDASVEATLALVKRLRAMSPRFETPIFYYRPYPGTTIAAGAQAAGYSFPRSLEDWADFDYVGRRGPWVSEAKWRRVERFGFYARHAWDDRPWRWPLKAASRLRLARDFYAFPLEKGLAEWLRPPAPLS